MIGLWNGSVVLELSGGRRVSVKLENLRSESRIQARELAERLAESRGERIKELQGQAKEAAAPAPTPLPTPPSAPEYVAPSAGLSVGDFLNQLDEGIVNGHILAIYDALPPSYRKDVDELVKLAAQKISPQTWQALVGTSHRVGELIVTRQRWLTSSPRVEALPPEQQDRIANQLVAFGGVLRAGLDPQAMNLQKLQSANFRDWLAQRDQEIAPHLAQLFNHMDVDSMREVTVEAEDSESATVTIGSEGATKKVSYSLVEGYWVPKSLADQWATLVEERKTQLAEAPAGTVLESYASMLEPLAPMLDPLAQAGTAGQFHAALESAFVPTETVMSTLATTLGSHMNLASTGSGGMGMGMEGYDDDGMSGEEEYPDDYDPFSGYGGGDEEE